MLLLGVYGNDRLCFCGGLVALHVLRRYMELQDGAAGLQL